MVIRWKNGLFRLWLVLSIFWILIVYIIESNNGFKPNFRTTVVVDIELKGGTRLSLDGALPFSTLREQIIANIFIDAANLIKSGKTEEAEKQKIGASETADELVNIVNSENEKRRIKILMSLVIIFAPPVIIFILGLLVIWIVQGFYGSRAEE